MAYILVHDGILGMKWGIRRYRNYDGSLTDEGKKRYGYGKAKYFRSVKRMPDAELNDRLSRLRKEKEYKDLTSKQKRPKQVGPVRKTIKKIIESVGDGTANAIRNTVQKKVGKMLTERFL